MFEFIKDKYKNTKNPPNFKEIASKYPDLFEKHLRFIDLMLHHAEHGAKIYKITGNHDNCLELLDGDNVFGINIRKDMMINIDKRKYVLEHGHLNDPGALLNYGGLYAACSKVLDHGLKLDSKLKEKGITEKFHTTNMLKKIGKFHIISFRQKAMDRAIKCGADGVILGHIHKEDIGELHPQHTVGFNKATGAAYNIKDRSAPPFHYINTGDGFTEGTGILHTPTTGFQALNKTSSTHSDSFDITKDNPYTAQRDKAFAYMEKLYATMLQVADFTKDWDHSGQKVEQLLRQREKCRLAAPSPRPPLIKTQAQDSLNPP
ncbi:MAG: hypothetical protein KTR28_01220 [Micavibrio sp.]|nr:hypothetical protein [Micavibrio sp.]